MTIVNSDTDKEVWGAQRSRTVTWHEPGPGTARGLAMAGIDYLKGMIAGELPPPPMAALLQFDLVEAEPGKVVFTCRPDGSVFNPNGGVHGGLVCTLLDSVAGLAVHSTLPAGKGYTSIEIKGELSEGGAARHRPVDRDRDRRQSGVAGGLYRGSRHRRVGCDRGDRYQHLVGVRPVATQLPGNG
jgi:acyl-coenzyme A thioesterase PaaI-like protein